jgi:cytoskeletal protein CcmA (bactofilin family)
MSESVHENPLGEITALLGVGTDFEGKLTFDGAVRLDGAFRGEIFADGTLVIGETAEVAAEIDVGVLIVRGGTVRGNIRAKRAVEVYVPGKIFGNITAPQVFIDKGVVFEGQCKMTDPSDA